MSRTTEDARALLRAAQHIHAEHHGSQEPGRPVSLNWSDDEVPPVAGAVGKRRRIHVPTYSS
jgi:hypothetical protein